MNVVNPGGGVSLPITTADLANGAVTEVKTNFDITPLSVAGGGTGGTKPPIVEIINADLLAQTGNLSNAVIATGLAGHGFWVTFMLAVISPTGTSSCNLSIGFTYNGVTQTFTNIISVSAATTTVAGSYAGFIFVDPSTNVTVSTSFTSGGAGDKYDLRLRLVDQNQ